MKPSFERMHEHEGMLMKTTIAKLETLHQALKCCKLANKHGELYRERLVIAIMIATFGSVQYDAYNQSPAAYEVY